MEPQQTVDLDEARRPHRTMNDPQSAENDAAWFRLGLLELREGRLEAARDLLSRAVAAAPREARYHIGLGQALANLGRPAEAVHAYRRAIDLGMNDPEVHFALGVALQSLGHHAEAEAAYAEALQRDPAHFAAQNNLGICAQRQGRFAIAAAAYERALALRPGQAGALANLGTVLQALGRLDDALRCLRRAAAQEPDVAAHAVNLGIALCRAGEYASAEIVLADCVQRHDGPAEALFNLGNALRGLGRKAEAVKSYARAAVLRPGYVDALINQANVHKEDGDFAAAAATYRRALAAAPGCVVASNNLACLMRSLGRLDDAEVILRAALDLEPDRAFLYDNLGSVLKDGGDLEAALECFRRSVLLDADQPTAHSNLVYALSFQAADAAPILEECRRWNRRFAAGLPAAAERNRLAGRAPQGGNPELSRRLRVGYVSGDFREHCQSLFTIPLFAHHDHAGFEVHCYSSVERPDGVTRRIAGYADVWREVRMQSDSDLAERIRADGIDILVDLTMHMSNGRPLTFARRPAGIQIAWLAYPGTTGLDAMDYRVTDPRLDPPRGAARGGAASDDVLPYTERSLVLPDSFWCYDPLTHGPDVAPLPALDRGYVTFGCLNNPCKLTDTTLRLWSALFRAMPDARLHLLAAEGRPRERLLGRLNAHGIAAHRVTFVPFRRRAEYLASYGEIDIGVDTLPYNGHTTSLDALWMGVPTVTRVGATCVGRAGLSQLYQLDLAHLATPSDAAFVEAACALASDLSALAALRAGLRTRMTGSALMDAPRFARHMEGLYRQAWTERCSRRSHAS